MRTLLVEKNTNLTALFCPSDINFTGSKTTVAVDSSATRLAVDCGSCSGTWDFSELDITGGVGSVVDPDDATVRYLSLLARFPVVQTLILICRSPAGPTEDVTLPLI